MKYISCSVAAAALAAMAAVPADAQTTTLQAEALPLPLPNIAATTLPVPAGADTVAVEVPASTVMQPRTFDAGGETYAIFDPATSTWRIHDAGTDALIDSVAVSGSAAPQVGMGTDELPSGMAATGAATADAEEWIMIFREGPEATAAVPEATMQVGMGEDRLPEAEADTRSYTVHHPVKSVWRLDHAPDGRPMEVLNDAEFDANERGHTIVLPELGPGAAQVGMGTDMLPPDNRDVVEIFD